MVTEFIKTRVSPDIKARVNEAAQRQLLTESVWLRRAVDSALRNTPASEDALIHRAGIRPSSEGHSSGPALHEHGSASAFGTVTD